VVKEGSKEGYEIKEREREKEREGKRIRITRILGLENIAFRTEELHFRSKIDFGDDIIFRNIVLLENSFENVNCWLGISDIYTSLEAHTWYRV
jgi:hypothetical protein